MAWYLWGLCLAELTDEATELGKVSSLFGHLVEIERLQA